MSWSNQWHHVFCDEHQLNLDLDLDFMHCTAAIWYHMTRRRSVVLIKVASECMFLIFCNTLTVYCNIFHLVHPLENWVQAPKSALCFFTATLFTSQTPPAVKRVAVAQGRINQASFPFTAEDSQWTPTADDWSQDLPHNKLSNPLRTPNSQHPQISWPGVGKKDTLL